MTWTSKFGLSLYGDINMESWGQTRKGRLCLNNDIFVSHVYKGQLCWLLLVNLTQTGAHWEKRNSVEELLPADWPQQVCGNIFLIANWYRRAKPAVGSVIPVQKGLSCLMKVDEQARGREPVSSINVSPPRFPSVMDYDQEVPTGSKLFLPSCFWSDFCPSNREIN